MREYMNGYYITLKREPYLSRMQTFESKFDIFYGFDKQYAGKHCHHWGLGEKVTDKLKFVYGNSYSHYLLFRHLSTINWTSHFVFVLEDDVVFYEDWEHNWENYSHYIPNDAELIYLHHHPSHEKKFGTHIDYALNEYIGKPLGPFSTTSYAITKQCVCKLLNYIDTHKIYRSFDSLLNIERENYNIYTLVHSICYENKGIYKSERLNN
tara:strand:+ start:2028 stop:2654 length:627 start_codon:yes stop_codon:yes gene_type:complete